MFCAEGRSAVIPPEALKIRSERSAMVAKMIKVSDRCAHRADTPNPVFHGCIDWHSAVHGVWSLVAAGDMLHDKALIESATKLLDPKGLADERSFLRANPTFEMPYGRAWFLRLAVDFERVAKDKRLREMANDVAESLSVNYVDKPVDPLLGAYASATWALINLRYYAEFTQNTELLRRIDERIDRDYLGSKRGQCPGLKLDSNMTEFMPICTNWAWLVSRRLPPLEFRKWVAEFLPAAALPAVIENPKPAHQYGLDFSRAWGLWAIYWSTDQSDYLRAYQAHVDTAFAHEDWWNGDYGTLGHWIAQFGILALYQSYKDFP
jgi:hypothetical protein